MEEKNELIKKQEVDIIQNKEVNKESEVKHETNRRKRHSLAQRENSLTKNIALFIIGIILGSVIGSLLTSNIEEINSMSDVNMLANTQSNVKEQESESKKQEKIVSSVPREDRLKTALKISLTTDEYEELKETVKEDEENYGDNYQKFDNYQEAYTRKPDTIYFKSPKVEGFYKFDKTDKDYNHLLEVSEDRMFYSSVEDFNLYCFTPDSIKKMLTSGDIYIIFDYDNEGLKKGDEGFQKPLVFRFNENTRLYRLATVLSYEKDLILVEDLDKNEFAINTEISGYKYIMNSYNNED